MSLKQLYIENATKETLLMEVEHLEAVVSELRAQLCESEKEAREFRKIKGHYQSLLQLSLTKDKEIHRLRKSFGIKKRVTKKEIIAMIESGASDAEIKQKLGVHRSSIYRAKEILGIVGRNKNEPTNNQ